MTTYERGYGGLTLNAQQLADLKTIYDATLAAFNAGGRSQVGLGFQIYTALLQDISAQPGLHGVHTPRPGVDPAVFNWISAAQYINGGAGLAADFIAEYTIDQYDLREGTSADAVAKAQEASNQQLLQEFCYCRWTGK